MIGAQAEALAGKRVIEAGCWNGRWLFAALQAGASHVVGTEEMPDWAEQARRNLEALGVPKERYTILVGNFFDHIDKVDFQVDTLLIPGFVGMGLRNSPSSTISERRTPRT
jgi:tRNA A58 N-methylase Trm61